jgi:hypothetical protein
MAEASPEPIGLESVAESQSRWERSAVTTTLDGILPKALEVHHYPAQSGSDDE